MNRYYPHPIIAQEGWALIIGGVVVSVIVMLLGGWWSLPFWLCTLFLLNFFRDPARNIPEAPDAILSPADGRVVAVEKAIDPYRNVDALKMSVLMSVLDVHSQRVPVRGKVTDVRYVSGSKSSVLPNRSRNDNARNAVLLTTSTGREITFVQVADWVAQRILCYVNKGDTLVRGERYGFVRFGARVDVYLPLDATANVAVGDKVRATETILAFLPLEQDPNFDPSTVTIASKHANSTAARLKADKADQATQQHDNLDAQIQARVAAEFAQQANDNHEKSEVAVRLAQIQAERQAEAQAENAERARILAQEEADAEAVRQRLAQEQLAEQAAEAERLAREQQAKLEAEQAARAEAERLAREQQARLQAEQSAKAEAERIAQEQQAKLAAEQAARAEAERLAREQQARLQAEQAAKAEAERIAQEQQAKLAAEQAARAEAERLAREQQARLQAEQAAKAEAERLAREQQAKLEAEQAARAEAERLAREQQARLQAEQAAKAEAERIAQEQQAKLAAEQAARAEAERLAREQQARLQAEQAAKAEAERIAQEQQAKLAAEQAARAEAERLAREQQARVLAEEKAAAEQAVHRARESAEKFRPSSEDKPDVKRFHQAEEKALAEIASREPIIRREAFATVPEPWQTVEPSEVVIKVEK